MECIWRSTLIALLTLTFLQGVGLGEESTGKISSLVLSKLEQMSADAQLGYTEEELGERHSSMFVFIDELARIYVRIVPEEGQAEGVGIEIAGMGGVVLNSTEEEIYCLINYTKVPAFEEMSGVLFVGIGPLPQVRTGSVTSEGDAQLFADKARDLFYTDGSNVMIGVISDGMQHRQNSINSGDLPPNIISIDFAHEYEGSEGTAMMEIVHDLAPGAQLAFGAVGRRNNIWATPLDMANRITHLRQAGCKVIVDDIGWPVGYSQFEDREITSSIEQFVQSSGGSYVSACGNDREIMWAGSSAPSGFHARKWMVFGADSALNVSVSEQGTLFVELQWADPWTNSLDDLDLFLMNQNGTIVASSATGGGSGIPPEENIEYSASAGTYRILVEWRNWYAGRPAKDFKLLVWGGSISSTSNYHVYGHAAAQNAISVAAYSASTPNTIESFSSRGPSIMVTSGGNTFQRETPKITATDDVQTKVGQDGNFGNPFTGTSAAAPHVAAIAGLYYSRFPSHSTGNFFSAMTSSASTIQTGQGGVYNSTSGFGKIRAYEAIVKSLVTLTSPQVTTNTSWVLVRVTGTATIAADRIVTIPATTTTLLEGSVVFGNVNAKIHVEGTLILAQGASVNPEQVLTFGNGRIVGGDFVTVIVTQVDINNSPFGSVERWRSTYFEPHAAPYTFGSQNNAQETFRALQDFKPGTTQKYHDWETYTNVANHQRFTIDPQHNSYKARFAPTEGGITIKTDLIDLPGTTGGDIQFRDPWYTDSLDAVHGSNPLNRGMQNAVFRNRPSPFNPDYDTEPTPGEQPYRGVFLNENPNWLPDRPNYSVGAPSVNTFTVGGQQYQAYFQGWTGNGDSIGYQNSAAEQTGVVFKQANAVATAKYKGHLISSLATATSTNSQRKYMADNFENDIRSAICYESGNQVWLGDGVYDYVEQLVSTGTDAYSMPSLLVANGGIMPFGEGEESSSETLPQIAVIYQKNGSTREVWFREKLASLSFTGNPTLLGTSTVDTRPVIGRRELDSDPRLLAVWQGASGLRFRSAPFQSGSWQWSAEGTIPGTSSARFNPSITNAPGYNDSIYLTLDNGSTVYLQSFSPSNAWRGSLLSVPASVSPTSYGSQVAFQLPNKVHVVWETYHSGNETRPGLGGGLESAQYKVMYQNRSGSSWGVAREFSYGSTSSIRRPSVTVLNDGTTIVTWDDGVSTYRAKFTDLVKPQVSLSQSGIRANLVGAGPNASLPTAKSINTATSGAPYAVQISAETFQRGEVELPMRYARRVVAARHSEDTSAIGYVSLEIGDVIVRRANGTLDTIPLVPEPENGAVLDERTLLNYLRTQTIDGGIQAESIYVEGKVRIRNAGPLSTGSLRFGFDVIDSRNEGVLRKVGTDFTVTSDTVIAVRATAAMSGLGNAPVRLRPRLAGLRSKLGGMVYSVVHVHMIEPLEEGVQSTTTTGHTYEPASLPVEFGLYQNYPNPFNPATTIRYNLPEESHVSLRVYDMLGREVAVIVEGMQSGGYHSAVLDGSDLASGVYFARFTATGEVGEIKYSRIGKLILMK